MKSGEIFWLTGTLFTVFIATGLLFNFSYFAYVHLQFHDTYIVIRPIYFGFLLWLVFVYPIFLIKEASNKFSNIVGLWILLITNSMITSIIVYIVYMVYAIFVLDAFVEWFQHSGQRDPILKSFYHAIFFWGFFLLMFSFIEYLLIRKLMKLNKKELK